MEIDSLLQFLTTEKLVRVTKQLNSGGYTFVDLLILQSKQNLTLQYNSKGLVSVYYINNQFYDIPDKTLLGIIQSIAEGRVVNHIDRKGVPYVTVSVDSHDIAPTRYTTI